VASDLLKHTPNPFRSRDRSLNAPPYRVEVLEVGRPPVVVERIARDSVPKQVTPPFDDDPDVWSERPAGKPAEGVKRDQSAHPIGDRKVDRRSAANETSLHPIHLMRFRRHCLERPSLALLQVPNDLGRKCQRGGVRYRHENVPRVGVRTYAE
jgi:hypothetical protein